MLPRRLTSTLAIGALGLLGLLGPLGAPAGASAATPGPGGRLTVTLATTTPRGELPIAGTLTIRRGTSTLYRAPTSYPTCGHRCSPSTAKLDRPLRIIALDGPGSEDVLVTLYTGGAHCCTVAEVLRPSAAPDGHYVLASTHDFGDPGYRLTTLAGAPAFVTGNDSFAYAFTDFAASGLPLKILRVEGDGWADVTADYPHLVSADAARWLTAYHKLATDHYQDSVGVIAAWAADEATLGQGQSALAYVRAQARAGHLNSGFGPSESGERFVTALQKLLRREHYLS